jgi:hypothetical protein
VRQQEGLSAVAKKQIDPDLEAQLVFDYYKQQREEFMNLSRERSSLSLQFLVILGALSLVFNQATSDLLRGGVGAVLLVLGSLGLIINISIERELRMHVVRARAARNSLGLFEEFAAAQATEPSARHGVRQDKLYFAFMILIVTVGMVFVLTTALK